MSNLYFTKIFKIFPIPIKYFYLTDSKDLIPTVFSYDQVCEKDQVNSLSSIKHDVLVGIWKSSDISCILSWPWFSLQVAIMVSSSTQDNHDYY